jgi:predicted membrane chloride channel (bestrophin family)
MAIIYCISFFLLFVPIMLIQKYIFNASFGTMLISTIFIAGWAITVSIENQFIKTIKAVSKEIITKIKK